MSRAPRHLLSETELRRQTADSLTYLYDDGRATKLDVVRWVRLSAKLSGRIYTPKYRAGGLGDRLRLVRREPLEERLFAKKAGYWRGRDCIGIHTHENMGRAALRGRDAKRLRIGEEVRIRGGYGDRYELVSIRGERAVIRSHVGGHTSTVPLADLWSLRTHARDRSRRRRR
jgi:hypothetical protein